MYEERLFNIESQQQIIMGCIQASPKRPDEYLTPTPEDTDPGGNTGDSPSSRPLPPPPPSPKQDSREVKMVVVALYDFNGLSEDDLAFRKGDRLEIFNGSDIAGDWWLGRHKNSTQVGYIPSNYVTENVDNTESQEWFAAVQRGQCERILLAEGLRRGTFMVRYTKEENMYALSVRDTNKTNGKADIKHFKIRRTDTDGFWISPKYCFDELSKLIAHYQAAGGLCCLLTNPYPKQKPIIPFREMEVPRESVIITKELGGGFFGRVYEGKLKTQDVAIKSLKEGKMSKKHFLREAKIMHELRHPKLVQLMGVCTIGEPLYIITELMVGGDLLTYLKSGPGKDTDLVHLIDMAAQVASGMSYLESHNYIHRDLRAANILVGLNNEVKVADFGLSRLVSKATNDVYLMSGDARFPVKWTSPEAGLKGTFSIKSDVWSFGILIYEMVTFGRIPYPTWGGKQTLEMTEAGYRMEKPTEECPDVVYELMLKCWAREPERRPTFAFLTDYLEDFMVSSQAPYRELDD
ncbi:tyrosine-protein kinase SRK3-like isoform X2 [Liolophura sinensis]|uniref:tyrosine-protein kinase SRK3-like isoform X2 n=1 Tax=Liolophura sinensis TaxID=3198878 RepID=UPI00315952BD